MRALSANEEAARLEHLRVLPPVLARAAIAMVGPAGLALQRLFDIAIDVALGAKSCAA